MAFIHIADKHKADHNAERDAQVLGTPEHFRRFCRAHATVGIAVMHPVEGFAIPQDGAWFVRGLARRAGEEVDLCVGDRVVYYDVVPSPDNPRGTAHVRNNTQAARAVAPRMSPKLDPVSMEPMIAVAGQRRR